MKIIALAGLSAACLAAALPARAHHCRNVDESAFTGKVASADAVIFYRLKPARIKVGEPFKMEVIACLGGRDGAPPDRMRIVARMPQHGHGMNYAPTQRRIAPGHSEFEGMLLHMPGRWELVFDLYSGSMRKRLTTELVPPK